MKIFEWELKQKNIIAKEYLKELEGYYGLPLIPKNSSSAWAQFTLQTKRRSKTLLYLKEKNIPTAIYYPIPMHKQPAYKKYNTNYIELNNSIELSKSVFSIPIHPYLDNIQREYIIKTLKDASKYSQ